ncbi:fatty acid-binding protein 12-like isoform X3 [Anthonomus grandis grandis]|uniref:fatty acid-binding protein 12-like isoform X3 n=2 Tax=Anthonomus grandis grandis TaxID=2921223 RepID=UPI002165250A|nr:fatty acid-binding protein 12-like isoform X3 [Anthonomus grandis grandis]
MQIKTLLIAYFHSKMVQIVGKYNHVKSENLDEYFKKLGVPYIPRKMMCASNPTLEISKSEDGSWTFTTTTAFRTVSYIFKLGEDYTETMPGGTLNCKTTMEDDKLLTVCSAQDGTEMTRTYVFTDDGLTITYKSKEIEAIRYYKRA